MSNLDSIELHDGVIKKMQIDYAAKTATVFIEIYKDHDTKARTGAEIQFKGVESISEISNFEHLQKNASAGNINYWAAANGSGTTYIYLSDGCIAIKASDVEVNIQKE